MIQAGSAHTSKIVLHDALALAQHGCSFEWAAQVFICFAEQGKSRPSTAGAPVEVWPDELLLAFQTQQLANLDALPLDPRFCSGPGVKLWTYRHWFSHPANQVWQDF